MIISNIWEKTCSKPPTIFLFFYMLGVDVQNLSKWVGPWILTQWQLFSTFQHLPCYRSFQYPKQGKPPPNFMSGINDLQEPARWDWFRQCLFASHFKKDSPAQSLGQTQPQTSLTATWPQNLSLAIHPPPVCLIISSSTLLFLGACPCSAHATRRLGSCSWWIQTNSGKLAFPIC